MLTSYSTVATRLLAVDMAAAAARQRMWHGRTHIFISVELLDACTRQLVIATTATLSGIAVGECRLVIDAARRHTMQSACNAHGRRLAGGQGRGGVRAALRRGGRGGRGGRLGADQRRRACQTVMRKTAAPSGIRRTRPRRPALVRIIHPGRAQITCCPYCGEGEGCKQTPAGESVQSDTLFGAARGRQATAPLVSEPLVPRKNNRKENPHQSSVPQSGSPPHRRWSRRADRWLALVSAG